MEDYKTRGEGFHCPQCTANLRLHHAQTNNTGRDVYRFRCRDRSHYRTRWHTSVEGAYRELEATFKGAES